MMMSWKILFSSSGLMVCCGFCINEILHFYGEEKIQMSCKERNKIYVLIIEFEFNRILTFLYYLELWTGGRLLTLSAVD